MAGDSEDAYIGLGKSVVKESMNLKNKMITHGFKLFNKKTAYYSGTPEFTHNGSCWSVFYFLCNVL